MTIEIGNYYITNEVYSSQSLILKVNNIKNDDIFPVKSSLLIEGRHSVIFRFDELHFSKALDYICKKTYEKTIKS